MVLIETELHPGHTVFQRVHMSRDANLFLNASFSVDIDHSDHYL